MRLLLTILIVVFVSTGLNAQQKITDAENLFNKRDYAGAAEIYTQLLEKKSSDMLLNYKMGRCLYELKQYENAVVYFQKSGNKYPYKDYYIADSYFLTYQFQQAFDYFTLFLSGTVTSKVFLRDAADKLKRSEIAARLIKRVEYVQILDSIIASKKDFLRLYKLNRESGKLNRQQINIAGRGLSELFSFVTQRGDRKIYTDTTGTNLDLKQSDKLLDGWSKGELLPNNINSSGDENCPFLMLDGITLYFASNNQLSIGGYDIFITRYNPEKSEYLNPENIGMPFNSIYNDYMFVVDESNHSGWFVSDRFQPKDKVMIYHFVMKDEKEYFKTDNDTIQRQVAMLKISKPKDATEPELTAVENIQKNIVTSPVQSVRQLLFMVNDTVYYTSTNQFKSQKALKMWYEKYRSENEYKESEMKLKALRTGYENAEDDEKRRALVADILKLEQKNLQFRLLLKNKDVIIRNEEINFLKKQN